MRGSGGTDGGLAQFSLGLFLAGLGTYFFLNSVYATTIGAGVISRAIGGRGGGLGETTSMGILFVPLLIGLIALFWDSRMKWAWLLTLFGLGILVIEILSGIRFRLEIKVTSLLLMMAIFAAGMGLMLRSYRDIGNGKGGRGEDNADGT